MPKAWICPCRADLSKKDDFTPTRKTRSEQVPTWRLIEIIIGIKNIFQKWLYHIRIFQLPFNKKLLFWPGSFYTICVYAIANAISINYILYNYFINLYFVQILNWGHYSWKCISVVWLHSFPMLLGCLFCLYHVTQHLNPHLSPLWSCWFCAMWHSCLLYFSE